MMELTKPISVEIEPQDYAVIMTALNELPRKISDGIARKLEAAAVKTAMAEAGADPK